MSKIYPGMTHLGGNILAAVDLETTGRRPNYHEIVQIAILPLNENLQAHSQIPVFYMNIRPEHPERAEQKAFFVNELDLDLLLIHAPSQDRTIDLFCEWFNRLDLPQNRSIIPLAHNWAFESAFLKGWLGPDLMDEMFHSHARDSMLLASAINDRAFFLGHKFPFPKLNLIQLCQQLGIVYEHAHDALADCQATAELYKRLLTYES